MALLRTGFRAEEHGFRFVNYFDFALEFELPFVEAVDLGNIIFGLCGGMCYAALDYYHAGWPIPDLTTQPQRGTRLYAYLWSRQLHSLSIPVVPLRVLEWMLRDDDDAAYLAARREFPRIEGRIARGNPAVICLIRAGGVADPMQNHQVVVVGYDRDEATGALTLFLYDPNHPGQETQIRLNLPAPRRRHVAAQEIALTQSTGEKLRGFFVLNYRARQEGLPATLAEALAPA